MRGVGSLYARGVKRTLDVLAALVLLPLVLLVVLLLSVLGAILWAGNPFFVQVRTGRSGRPFRLLKLRSLRDALGPDGTLLPDAQRLTPYGRWLRASSLDELPQLLHVLLGQMSLVGPRPLLPEYTTHYSPRQALRLAVRPGLTGLAQISGRNALGWPEQLELDARYVETLSWRTDWSILCSTIAVWWGRRGIQASGHATRPRFDA